MNSNMRMNSRFKICNSLKKTECLILLKEYLSYEELKKAIEPTQEQIYKLMNAFTKSDLQNIVYNTQAISTDLLTQEINLNEEIYESENEEIIVVKKPAEPKKNPILNTLTEGEKPPKKSDTKKITINDNSIKQEVDFIEVIPNETDKTVAKDNEEEYLKIANELNKIKTYKNVVIKIKEDRIPKHIYDRYFAELKPKMIKKLNGVNGGEYETLSVKDLYELMQLCN